MKEWVVIQDAREEGYLERDTVKISEMLRSGKTAEEIADFCGDMFSEPFKICKFPH